MSILSATLISRTCALLALLASNAVFAQLPEVMATITQLEDQLQARIGVTVYDLETDEQVEHHGNDRFPMSSTFKTLACAALLHRVDTNQDSLQRRITFKNDTLVSYSPVTENYIGEVGMTLSQLCEATITMSDNTAGNLVLDAIGGPKGLTQFLRSLGDDVTRLDRWETDLNESLPGDARDTTSPNAMVATLNTLLFGDGLSTESQAQLKTWLRGNAVGDALLRAGIPSDWSIGDKTGAGGFGSRSIAAVMWPPNRRPIITTIYITETTASFEERNAAIADIGKAIARAVAKP